MYVGFFKKIRTVKGTSKEHNVCNCLCVPLMPNKKSTLVKETKMENFLTLHFRQYLSWKLLSIKRNEDKKNKMNITRKFINIFHTT